MGDDCERAAMDITDTTNWPSKKLREFVREANARTTDEVLATASRGIRSCAGSRTSTTSSGWYGKINGGRGGCHFGVVKGRGRLMLVSQGKKSVTLRSLKFRVRDYDTGYMMWAMYGDGRPVHPDAVERGGRRRKGRIPRRVRASQVVVAPDLPPPHHGLPHPGGEPWRCDATGRGGCRFTPRMRCLLRGTEASGEAGVEFNPPGSPNLLRKGGGVPKFLPVPGNLVRLAPLRANPGRPRSSRRSSRRW